MKCEHCGGNLTLEDVACPYCGKENPHAKQHISDMKRYNSDFSNTRREVYSVVNKYSGITVRAVVIVLLLIAIVVAGVVCSESYSIKRHMEQTNSAKHVEEYMEIMDTYLAEEDYLSFKAFCDAHYIEGFDDSYTKYRPIILTVNQYSIICYHLMRIATAENREEQGRFLGYMYDSIEYFYKYMDIEQFQYYEGAVCQENVQLLQKIEENMQVLFRTYLGLSAEEAAGFAELSQAKRMVLIEERLYAE